jgi:hypothetical protein
MAPNPMNALDLEGDKPPRKDAPLSRPAMPESWRNLVQTARPRDVYLSPEAKTRTVIGVALLLAFAGVGVGISLNTPSSAVVVMGMLMTALFLYLAVAAVLTARNQLELVREGELTPGVLTDYREGRRGTVFLSYQFWTDSGEIFKGSGTLVPGKDPAIGKQPLQVFYLPHDPKKNLALACTMVRIRLN